MDLKYLSEHAGYIVVLVGFAVAVATYGRKAFKMLSTIASFCKSITQVPGQVACLQATATQLQQTTEQLKTLPAAIARIDATVAKELTVNGGGSMKDELGRCLNRLSMSEARAWFQLQNGGHAYWESDAAGNCIRVSRDLALLARRSEADFLGMGWLGCIAPADREEVETYWQECMVHGRQFTMDYSLITPEGTPVPVYAETFVAHNSKGAVVGYIGRCVRRGIEVPAP